MEHAETLKKLIEEENVAGLLPFLKSLSRKEREALAAAAKKLFDHYHDFSVETVEDHSQPAIRGGFSLVSFPRRYPQSSLRSLTSLIHREMKVFHIVRDQVFHGCPIC